mmetsp:Transcript_25384/g.29397  ORF Transcript_25384/g.29397 Transcript_25384/m.29397 type:complete len:221 (-) Transcript_25384:230-892(-)
MYIISISLVALCSLTSSFGFVHHTSTTSTPHSSLSRKLHKLHLSDRGWDNGNFLDALGSDQNKRNEVNEKYYQEAEARAAWEDRKFKAMTQNDNEFQNESTRSNEEVFNNVPIAEAMHVDNNASGSQKFQNMMSQAQQFQQMQPAPAMNQPQQPPVQNNQSQVQDPQAYYQALEAWQKAMTAFQQFSQTNPEAASQMALPPPPPPPPAFVPMNQSQQRSE